MDTLQKEIDDKMAASEEPSNGNERDGSEDTQSQHPAKIKSPSLLEIGLSKNALRSMGIHFRKDEEEEQENVGQTQTRASKQLHTNHAGIMSFLLLSGETRRIVLGPSNCTVKARFSGKSVTQLLPAKSRFFAIWSRLMY